MKEFFSKLWVKITAISLVVVLFLFSILLLLNSFALYNPKCYHVFALSGIFGSFDKKGNPSTYYQIEKTSNVVEFIDLRPDNSKVISVWINISDMEEDADIYLYNGEDNNDATKKISLNLLSKTTLTGKDLNKDKDGWICLYKVEPNTKTHNLRFCIGSTTKMCIREVVFVHETGGTIAYKTKGIVRRGSVGAQTISADDSLYENFDYETLSSSTDYTTTFTKKMQERLNSLVNLNDEQKTFDNEKIK